MLLLRFLVKKVFSVEGIKECPVISNKSISLHFIALLKPRVKYFISYIIFDCFLKLLFRYFISSDTMHKRRASNLDAAN